jgi:hypothetical protein
MLTILAGVATWEREIMLEHTAHHLRQLCSGVRALKLEGRVEQVEQRRLPPPSDG